MSRKIYIIQVNCIEDSHLLTKEMPLDNVVPWVDAARERGLIITEDDGSMTAWPPHLLGCFQIYEK